MMSLEEFYANLNLQANRLTKKDRMVMDYIKQDPERFVTASGRDIAEELQVSEATISRFCQKVGFGGFNEMRFTLTQVLQQQGERSVGETADLSSQLVRDYYTIIQQAQALLNIKDIERCAQHIVDARNIYVAGMGSSGFTALEMSSKFSRLGLNVQAVTDNYFIRIKAVNMTKEDVFIGVTLSGETEEILFGLESAKAIGAPTIVITNFAHSSATEFADIVLLTPQRKSVPTQMLISAQLAQLYVIDMLYTDVVAKDTAANTEKIERITRLITER